MACNCKRVNPRKSEMGSRRNIVCILFCRDAMGLRKLGGRDKNLASSGLVQSGANSKAYKHRRSTVT